ncbi:SIR2 family protein [Burkholderia ubonensis]|uniref:SIR2 family protein n=1 Tax=Burkholderia ubonensis TaxID=101571 RepID=UPI0012F8C48B|nr:SIR2 family protein [Burkholderia ubonensis]
MRTSVYVETGKRKHTHSAALATLYWPLVCTTNYDDVYISEAMKRRHALPRVNGRSEYDCRRVLQHMAMPSGEVIWALQGFLKPRFPQLEVCVGANPKRLERELIVGPVEYRQVANREPQFRRCFAEVFRHRSLFFLGSGLTEPYLLTLFDEIVELLGPPPRPHFALVPEGMLDSDFMREHYHIACRTYPSEDHDQVSSLVSQLVEFINGDRSRPRSWGYRLQTPMKVEARHCDAHFEVVRGPLPSPSYLPDDEVLAISCGREPNPRAPSDDRGQPIPSHLIEGRVPEASRSTYNWHERWAVNWPDSPKVFGIVARLPLERGVLSSRDARSPEAIRRSFVSFLDAVATRGATTAHVQLLAAGVSKVFHPWISLVQTARAYGQWFRARPHGAPPLRVVLYVVAPDVVTLLNGGYLDLSEHLQDAQMRIGVEVIDFFGRAQSHHQLVDASAPLGSLPEFNMKSAMIPRVYALPIPRLRSTPMPLDHEAREMQLRDFGLVSGSTLVVDYRPEISA